MPVYLQSMSPIFVIIDNSDPRQQKIIKAFFNGTKSLSTLPSGVEVLETENGVQLALPNIMDLADGVQLLSKILGITQWMGGICSAAKIPEK